MVLLDDSLVGFERNTTHFENYFALSLTRDFADTEHGGLRVLELKPYAFFLFISVLFFTSASPFFCVVSFLFTWFLFYLPGFFFYLRGFFLSTLSFLFA